MEEIDEQTDDMGGKQAKQIFLKAKKTMFQTEEKTVLIHSTKRLGVFSGSSDGEESACNAGDLGSIPGSGRPAGEGIGNPLQCTYLSKVSGTDRQTDTHTHTDRHTHTHYRRGNVLTCFLSYMP